MALDGLGQFLNPKINRAASDTLAAGVTFHAGQCAWLAHGEHEVVKLAVWFGDHGVNGAEGVPAGGVFVGRQVARVGQVTGANTAGDVVVVVGVLLVDGEVGQVALLLFAGHEAEDGVGDLLLVELRLAGLVKIAGGLAELFVDEVVERLVNGDVAGAETVTVKGADDAGAKCGALVKVGFEGEPLVVVAGGINFGVPFARGRWCGGDLFGNVHLFMIKDN